MGSCEQGLAANDAARWQVEQGREKLVQQMQRAMAEDALKSGLSVIVDDTNLAPKHEATYRQLAEQYGAEFEIKEFSVSVEECVERDLQRPAPVGKDVILRMFYQSLCQPQKPRTELPPAIICDIDGTLALMKDRSPFEWEKVGQDDLNQAVAMILREFSHGKIKILIVSVVMRSARRRRRIGWNVMASTTDGFWMRPAGNTEKDTVIKERIYREHIEGKYDVIAVFDDRPSVVRFWRQQGLFVFDCGNGIEF